MTRPARKTAPPPAGRRPRVRVCDWCHGAFWDLDGRKRFCKATCRQAYHHELQARGKRAYEELMGLRQRRERGAFTKLTRLADQWIHEDKMKAKARREALAAARPRERQGR